MSCQRYSFRVTEATREAPREAPRAATREATRGRREENKREIEGVRLRL